MSFDITSYLLGYKSGDKIVNIDGSINCTDDGDGNITIEEENDGE